jgi:hypothetical protein
MERKEPKSDSKEVLGGSNAKPAEPTQGELATAGQSQVASTPAGPVISAGPKPKNSVIASGAPSQASSVPSYPWHNNIQTSWFYIGEPSDASNGYIPNNVSAWDDSWMLHYGGVDSPTKRVAPYYYPSFKPKENPFYFALPYSDLTDSGSRKANAKNIPWWNGDPGSGVSVVKNRWIEISYNGKVAYAQWEDVGPSKTDDFNYVFGGAAPLNTFGVHAGLDISPATRDFLNCDNGKASWRFVDAKDVPAGPWKNVVTTSQISW